MKETTTIFTDMEIEQNVILGNCYFVFKDQIHEFKNDNIIILMYILVCSRSSNSISHGR